MLGVDWNISQNIRNMVMESLSGVRGENSVKIIGPDLAGLERLSDQVAKVLGSVPGVFDVGIYHIMGQSNLTFPIDRDKCAQWGVAVADAQDVIATAVGGKPLSQMIEGERSFDITLRWPAALRGDEQAILDIPLDTIGNNVTSSPTPTLNTTLLTGAASGPATIGSSTNMPSLVGSASGGALNDLTRTPRIPLRKLITPQDAEGRPASDDYLVQPGASDIFRDQGQRLIAIKFDVRGRDLAGAVAEAQRKVGPLIAPPYRVRMGRRIPRNGRCRTPADDRHPACLRHDYRATVHDLPFADRRLAGALQCAWRMSAAASGRCCSRIPTSVSPPPWGSSPFSAWRS